MYLANFQQSSNNRSQILHWNTIENRIMANITSHKILIICISDVNVAFCSVSYTNIYSASFHTRMSVCTVKNVATQQTMWVYSKIWTKVLPNTFTLNEKKSKSCLICHTRHNVHGKTGDENDNQQRKHETPAR